MHNDDHLMQEIENDILRWQIMQEQATELVKDRGWLETDEDFYGQVEEEAKRLWAENLEREFFKNHIFEEQEGAAG